MQDTQFYFYTISLHQRHGIIHVSFLKKKMSYRLGMSKVLLTSCSFSPGSRSFSHQKSIVESLSRNFCLRTDKHTLTKVLKCFILSHASVFKHILSGHGYMSRHFIEVYASQVISNVSKHNTWYSKEEKPRLKKRKQT